jgi:Domain of unknown function (DUF4263)
MPATPELVFLGIAERASAVREGDSTLLKWHLIGLKSFLPSFCYPAALLGLNFVFAIRYLAPGPDLRISIRSGSRQEIGFFNIALAPEATPPTPPLTSMSGQRLIFSLPEAWSPVVAQFNGPSPLVFLGPGRCPGRYLLYQGATEGTEKLIGEFYCIAFDPPPLTPERIAAIKSDPRAMKAVRATVFCEECQSKIQMYAALERSPALEAEGYTWYTDLPDTFRCSCGKSDIDLRSIRKNLFGYLGEVYTSDQTLNYVPLYENTTLDNIRKEFTHLLNINPKEEIIQKFLENNPILFRQFPAEKILFKPPILTRYIADFAIVSPQRELILIEIEPANMNLLRKNGDHAAPLTHAVNQVQNWMQVVAEHRNAFLSELKIDMASVGTVRGVVIGGRDKGYDLSHLRQLKSVFSGNILVLTYDDLLGSLVSLIEQVGRL